MPVKTTDKNASALSSVLYQGHDHSSSTIRPITIVLPSTGHSMPSLNVHAALNELGKMSTVTHKCIRKLLKANGETTMPNKPTELLSWFLEDCGNIRNTVFRVVPSAKHDVELCRKDFLLIEKDLKSSAKQGIYSFFSTISKEARAKAEQQAPLQNNRTEQEEDEYVRQMQELLEKEKGNTAGDEGKGKGSDNTSGGSGNTSGSAGATGNMLSQG